MCVCVCVVDVGTRQVQQLPTGGQQAGQPLHTLTMNGTETGKQQPHTLPHRSGLVAWNSALPSARRKKKERHLPSRGVARTGTRASPRLPCGFPADSPAVQPSLIETSLVRNSVSQSSRRWHHHHLSGPLLTTPHPKSRRRYLIRTETTNPDGGFRPALASSPSLRIASSVSEAQTPCVRARPTAGRAPTSQSFVPRNL
jgi:hypothetical protein